MHIKLIVVANLKEVKFFKGVGLKFKGLLKKYSAKDFDLHHNRQKRREGFNSKLSLQSHFFDPHSEPKALEEYDFARIISNFMNDICKKGLYDELIIIAEPKLLGQLRKSLKHHLKIRAKVTKEIPKDYIHSSDALVASVAGLTV